MVSFITVRNNLIKTLVFLDADPQQQHRLQLLLQPTLPLQQVGPNFFSLSFLF